MRLRRRARAKATKIITSSDWDPSGGKEPPVDPVKALYHLPLGPNYILDEFRENGLPCKVITIGGSSYSDIFVAGADAEHCLIKRSNHGHVFIQRSTNAENSTKVNRVRVIEAEIGPRDLVRVGRARFVVLGATSFKNGDYRARITSTDINEYLRQAKVIYRTWSNVSRFLKTAVSTMARWLQEGKFKTGATTDRELHNR